MKLLNIDYKKCIYEILKGLLWYICILWLIRRKKTPLHSLVGTDSWLRSFKKLKPQKMWSTCIIILINHNDCNQPFAMKITFRIHFPSHERMLTICFLFRNLTNGICFANLLIYSFHKWIFNEKFEICYLKLSDWPMARDYCLCTPNSLQLCSRNFEFFLVDSDQNWRLQHVHTISFFLKHHLSYRFHFENIKSILMAF